MTNVFQQTVNVVNGTATVQIDTDDYPNNYYTITATYNGTDRYKPATGNGTLAIQSASEYFTSMDINIWEYDVETGVLAMDIDVNNTDVTVEGDWSGYSDVTDLTSDWLSENYNGWLLAATNQGHVLLEFGEDGWSGISDEYVVADGNAFYEWIGYQEGQLGGKELGGSNPDWEEIFFVYAIEDGIFSIVLEDECLSNANDNTYGIVWMLVLLPTGGNEEDTMVLKSENFDENVYE